MWIILTIWTQIKEEKKQNKVVHGSVIKRESLRTPVLVKLERGVDIGVAGTSQGRKRSKKVSANSPSKKVKLLPNKGIEKCLKVLKKKKFKAPANQVKLEQAKKTIGFSPLGKIFN